MSLTQRRINTLLIVIGILLAVLASLLVQPAYASVRDDLENNYQAAVINYENVVVAQDRNNAEILKAEDEIAVAERKIARAEDELGDTAVVLYKNERGSRSLVDLLLDSTSFQDAVMRYDQYTKIADYYRDKANELEQQKAQIAMRKGVLEQRKVEIELEVEAAKKATEEAALALLDLTHTDGASFHQVQGNDSNCGATAFIVGVNVLLHENRYMDNVGVWNGPGFNGDSTTDLAYRASVWLVANGLEAQITAERLPGDIHTTDELRDQLEQGKVVVMSSGSGSVFQHADGGHAAEGSYPDGHWILVYCYDNGIFYVNDSAVIGTQGAGCPYTQEQMQQWLDGRSNHFATALSKI